MFGKYIYIVPTTILACVLTAAGVFAQDAPVRCDANDSECKKAEKEEAYAERERRDGPSAAVKFESVKFDPNFTLGSPGAFKRYGSEHGPEYRESVRQQQPQDNANELAKKLANPVSSLISLPLQNNFDFGMGPDGDGFRYTLNVQPVIPVRLNKDWNMISRTVVPIIGQNDVVGTSSQFGLGDTVQTFFFSPNKSKPFVWAIGPQILIPTATNAYLGSQKLGLGPSFLILKQQGKWSVGALVSQMWSVAGKSSRSSVSSTFLQPFVSYTTKTAWTIGLNTESNYDWTGKAWGVPIHFTVSKLVKIGKRRASVGGALPLLGNEPCRGTGVVRFQAYIYAAFPSVIETANNRKCRFEN